MKTRPFTLRVGSAVLILATRLREHSCDKVLIDDRGKGDAAEGSQGELVVKGYRRYVDVAATGDVPLGVEMDAHGFPELAEDAANLLGCVEAGGDDLHAD